MEELILNIFKINGLNGVAKHLHLLTDRRLNSYKKYLEDKLKKEDCDFCISVYNLLCDVIDENINQRNIAKEIRQSQLNH